MILPWVDACGPVRAGGWMCVSAFVCALVFARALCVCVCCLIMFMFVFVWVLLMALHFGGPLFEPSPS